MRSGLLIVPVVGLTALVLLGCGGSSSPAQPSGSTYVIPAAELSEMLVEKTMGSATASVTLVEYSSLTCPHCTSFHLSALPQVKAAYIDTGKVRLIYRDFPVPGASTLAAAYAAAALARCAGNARYFEAVDLLSRTQAAWTSAASPVSAMKQALAPMGMGPDKMDACVASAQIQAEINRLAGEARATYGVTGTPTFIVGGQKIEGERSFAEFDAILGGLVK